MTPHAPSRLPRPAVRSGFIAGIAAIALIAVLGVALYLATGGSVQQMTSWCIKSAHWITAHIKTFLSRVG